MWGGGGGGGGGGVRKDRWNVVRPLNSLIYCDALSDNMRVELK